MEQIMQKLVSYLESNSIDSLVEYPEAYFDDTTEDMSVATFISYISSSNKGFERNMYAFEHLIEGYGGKPNHITFSELQKLWH